MKSNALLEMMETLHSSAASRFLNNVIDCGDLLQIVIAPDYAERSNFLRAIHRLFLKQQLNDKWQMKVCSTLNLPKMIQEVEEDKYDKCSILLVNDLNKDYSIMTENSLWHLISSQSNTDRKIAVIATTGRQIDFHMRENQLRDIVINGEEDSLFLASKAISFFRNEQLTPDFQSYLQSVLAFLDRLLSQQGDFKYDGDRYLLSTYFLEFTGPYPPYIHALAELVLSFRVNLNDISRVRDDQVLGQRIALQCLAEGADLCAENTIRWVCENRTQAKHLLEKVATSGQEALHDIERMRLSIFLESACMSWPKKIGDSRSDKVDVLAPMIEMGIRESFLRSRPANSLSPVTNPTVIQREETTTKIVRLREGAIRIELSAENPPIVVLLSEIEWKIIAKMAVSEINKIEDLALNTGYTAIQTRSAIHRIIDKLHEVGESWILTNVKRHGYVLNLQFS